MKFGAKKNTTVLAGGSRFAPNFIQNLYTVLKKKIVGISQYAYFSVQEFPFDVKCESSPYYFKYGSC
jgi:hypothetical protein